MSAATPSIVGGPRWAVPYRSLRPVSLVVQLLVLAAAEVMLFASYAGHDSRFHWAAHFLVGLIAATAWLSAYLLIAARPAPLQLGTVLVFHLIAMAPDLLFIAGVPHYPWMNAFFGHVAVHYIPGADTTWLVLALIALAAYAWLLTRWLAARHAEAAAGLAPGIGIGGSAVIRPQLNPRTHQLAHVHTGDSDREPVLLLHGLGGTSTQWTDVAQSLATRGIASLAVDLLGHGHSLRLGTRFTAADQVTALVRLLDHHHLATVTVAGHSYGSAIAAALAQQTPTRVRQLLLICPPAYKDAETGRRRLGDRSWMARRTVQGAPVVNLVCGAMCLSRGPLQRLAPRARGDLAADVARGGLAHTYPAYWDAIGTLVRDSPLPRALQHPPVPTAVLVATNDTTAPPTDVLDVARSPHVTVTEIEGTHELTITRPEAVGDYIAQAVQIHPPT